MRIILKWGYYLCVLQVFFCTIKSLENRACVEESKSSHPRVTRRFSDHQLDSWCGDMDRWISQILKYAIQLDYSFYQRQFLTQIQRCSSNADCFGYRKKGKRNVLLEPAVRKECRAMSKREYKELTDALNRLKTEKIDNMTKYDLIISYHDPKQSPAAHFGPAFLPFHREYLKQLEVALRQVNPNVALCYWDSNLDEGLPKPWESVLWTPELYGNGNKSVVEGPFGNWVVTRQIPGVKGQFIQRDVGGSDAWDLYRQDDFDFFMTKKKYQDLASYCTEPTFTVLHNSVHEFVGGHMIYTAISPNDPVFFLHHAFVDYFWEMWRIENQNDEEKETDYPADGPIACHEHHYAKAPMRPFPLQNVHGLRNNYTSLFVYDRAPSCQAGTCTGPYLFCDTDRERCVSKVRAGGSCHGLGHFDVCYESTCVDDVCVKVEAEEHMETIAPDFEDWSDNNAEFDRFDNPFQG